MNRFRFIKQAIPAAIAIGAAIVVSLGYLLPNFAITYRGQATGINNVLIEWAVIIAAFAFPLGVFNLFVVHVSKIRQRQAQGFYSGVFIIFTLATLLISILPILDYAPASEFKQGVFDYIISPVGASLAALLVFTLTLAAFRLLRARRNAWAILFALVVVIVLATTVPLAGLPTEPFSTIRHWTVNVLGMAGVRGLLLGVVLGTVVTAVRVLWPRGES